MLKLTVERGTLEGLVTKAVYYSGHFEREIFDWFFHKEYNGKKWIERSEEDREYRTKISEYFVGKYLTEQLKKISRLELNEVYELVQEVGDRFLNFENETDYWKLSEEHTIWYNIAEDLVFYVGEIASTLEIVYNLKFSSVEAEEVMLEVINDIR